MKSMKEKPKSAPAARAAAKKPALRMVLDFKPKNYILFAAGVLSIGLGFMFLKLGTATGWQSMTMAPILLVLGFCVLIPVAILLK